MRNALLKIMTPLLVVQSLCMGFAAADQAIEATPEQIDFAVPKRVYRDISHGGWKIVVEKELTFRSPDIAEQAVKRLVKNLGKIRDVLPAASREMPEHLTYYLLYGSHSRMGGRDNGVEYIEKSAPASHPELDPRWSDSIVVYSAENYAQLSNLGAMKTLMHELAHAYHLERWPETQPEIVRAWQNATDQRLYQNVKDLNGKKISAAYAQTNPVEYFAELSACYFVDIDYQPYNRAGLKRTDPVGHALIKKMWNAPAN